MKDNNITKTPEEQKLIRENEILGKVVLEIMLKHSTRLSRYWKEKPKTDEQIDKLLNQPDWKEATKFEVTTSKTKGKEGKPLIGHQWTDTWLLSAREPIAIIERLKKEKEEAMDNDTKVKCLYLEQLEEKEKSINQLKEENEKLKEQNYQLIAQVEEKIK